MLRLNRVDQALAWAREYLASGDHTEPLDAAVLLAHVLGVARAVLLARPEMALAQDDARAFRALVERRAEGVPVAYLTGRHAFFDRELAVTPAVLIPRPETEHLVEVALDWARDKKKLRIVDVGTGSGALAVTLAAHLPTADVWAVDVSPDALAVARSNAAQAGLDGRIRWVAGDLLAPLIAAGWQADLVVANLPYIPSGEVDHLAVARHEPRLALDGGADGLDLIRRLLGQLPQALAADGLALLEIGAGQGPAVQALAGQALPDAAVGLQRDYAGHDRVVRIERKG